MKNDNPQYEIDQWAAAPVWKLVAVGVAMVAMVAVINIIKLFSFMVQRVRQTGYVDSWFL